MNKVIEAFHGFAILSPIKNVPKHDTILSSKFTDIVSV